MMCIERGGGAKGLSLSEGVKFSSKFKDTFQVNKSCFLANKNNTTNTAVSAFMQDFTF